MERNQEAFRAAPPQGLHHADLSVLTLELLHYRLFGHGTESSNNSEENISFFPHLYPFVFGVLCLLSGQLQLEAISLVLLRVSPHSFSKAANWKLRV